MEKTRTIKIWPTAHVEIRIHASKKMIEDFKKCMKVAQEVLKTGNDNLAPDCDECSWGDVCIDGKGVCAIFNDEIKEQLEENVHE